MGPKTYKIFSRFDEFFHLYFNIELLEDFNNDFGFWNTYHVPKLSNNVNVKLKINPKLMQNIFG